MCEMSGSFLKIIHLYSDKLKPCIQTFKWVLIAGSPCQDLTFAGYLNCLLGLTGRRSMLFFTVYIVLCHLQCLFGFLQVRFLTENAGTMQPVQSSLSKRRIRIRGAILMHLTCRSWLLVNFRCVLPVSVQG